MIDRVIFNIDDEYVLHICNGKYMRYEIYKPKHWTDATHYVNAWSNDGKTWLLMDICGYKLKYIETILLSEVIEEIQVYNKYRRYKAQPSMNCAGQSSKATDFKKTIYNTINDIEENE
jgi:hypothetical protein